MREAYQTFFQHFKIDFQDIIEFGVELDTIYPKPDEIKVEWKSLINSIQNNNEVFIRGYGRDAKGTYLYQELFKIILNNNNIKKDSTNNTKPTQLLQKITGFSKTIKKDNEKKKKISNYQVTHIFGKTKNPFLFTAPWNIVWKSKILDPFTGHESKGENTEEYKIAFIKKSKELYSEFIDEYNSLALKYFSEDKLEKAFDIMENSLDIDKTTFNKFKIDAKNELKPIE
ncbi:hypothetical protein [Sulfurimonas hydrogeniphila]|uniref:hypothetical protein n=1 Tax=Sulfurimonas TaxID=202746 RepID=UPI00125F5F03|nr:hypothetical protein [Sulfurimonas hydrogeniphila]